MVRVISVMRPMISSIVISTLVLPTLLQDITEEADKWGKNGSIDPFTEIYDVSFLRRELLGSVSSLPFF